MNKATQLLGLSGIVFLIWGLGTFTHLWSNPLFHVFFIVSNTVANVLSYVGIGIGVCLLAFALIIFYRTRNERTNRLKQVNPNHRLKNKVEFNEGYLQRKLSQQKDFEENQPFIIVNGNRTELGFEDIEKIVN